jgi:hypothetical protein
MDKLSVSIPNEISPPPSSQQLLSLKSSESGGVFNHFERRTKRNFERNGSISTLELSIQNVSGSAWASVSVDNRVLLSVLLFPSTTCGDPDMKIGSLGLPGDRWLRSLFRSMGLASEESLHYRDAATEVIEVPFHHGVVIFQLLVRRVSHGTPQTPQRSPLCSYLILLRQDDHIIAAQII